MGLLGIDISMWNGVLDWQKAAAAGVKFAMMKASQANYPDGKFKANWSAAKGLVLRGAYHYYDWSVPPLLQANRFIASLAGDRGELPPVLDYEELGGIPAKATALAGLRQWLDRIETVTGRVPILYTSYGMWQAHGSADASWARYPLWLAAYTAGEPMIPRPWERYLFWQYTSSARGADFGAVNGTMDLNRFDGNLEDLFTLAGTQPPQVETGETMEYPVIYKKVATTSWGFIPVRNGPANDGTADLFGLMAGAVVGVPDFRYFDGTDTSAVNFHDGSCCIVDLSKVDPNLTVALPLPQGALAAGNYAHVAADAWQKIASANPYGTKRAWIVSMTKQLVDDSSLAQPAGLDMLTVNILNIRSAPSIHASIVGQYPASTRVRVTRMDFQSGNWWAQVGPGRWCAAEYGGVQYLG